MKDPFEPFCRVHDIKMYDRNPPDENGCQLFGIRNRYSCPIEVCDSEKIEFRRKQT